VPWLAGNGVAVGSFGGVRKARLIDLPRPVAEHTYLRADCDLAPCFFYLRGQGAEPPVEPKFYHKTRTPSLKYSMEIWTTGIIEAEVNDPFLEREGSSKPH
jgi:hypothetical protein